MLFSATVSNLPSTAVAKLPISGQTASSGEVTAYITTVSTDCIPENGSLIIAYSETGYLPENSGLAFIKKFTDNCCYLA